MGQMIWSALTFPFRLIGGVASAFGRLIAGVAGFCLMVGGTALCAGTIWLLGLPVFVVGLLITLRALR
jgi:TM2 domain-containing membrane protein YozV